MLFKRFLIWTSATPPIQWSGTSYTVLKGGIIGNIHVKLFGPVVQEMSFKESLGSTDAQQRP